MRTELCSGLGARCAQAGQGKGHLLPAPGTGALGMGSESGGSHGGLCQPPACPHLPSKAAQRMGRRAIPPREAQGAASVSHCDLCPECFAFENHFNSFSGHTATTKEYLELRE